MSAIEMTPRELWGLAIGGAALCFVVGVLMACLTIAIFILPRHNTETNQRVELAYIKGAMIRIADSRTKCREFSIDGGVARCV